jgi:hypothetical protein
VHRKNIPIYIQQDATLHSLFISGNCSTCFWWYFHPSSVAHTTVSTASVIFHTVTATCRYRGRVGTGLSVLWVAGSSNGVTIPDAVGMRSWWWVKVPPETCKAVSRYNKLCNVESCWIYIGILLNPTPPVIIAVGRGHSRRNYSLAVCWILQQQWKRKSYLYAEKWGCINVCVCVCVCVWMR